MIDRSEVIAMSGKNRLNPGRPAEGFSLRGPAGLTDPSRPVSVVRGSEWTAATPTDMAYANALDLTTVIPPRYHRKGKGAVLGHVTQGQVYEDGIPTGRPVEIPKNVLSKVVVEEDPFKKIRKTGGEEPMSDLSNLQTQMNETRQQMAMMFDLLATMAENQKGQQAAPSSPVQPAPQPVSNTGYAASAPPPQTPYPQQDFTFVPKQAAQSNVVSADPWKNEPFANDPSISPVSAAPPPPQNVAPDYQYAPPGPPDVEAEQIPEANVEEDKRVVEISADRGSQVLLRIEDVYVFDTPRAFLVVGSSSVSAQLEGFFAQDSSNKYRFCHIIKQVSVTSLAAEPVMIDRSTSGYMIGGHKDASDMYITVLWKQTSAQ